MLGFKNFNFTGGQSTRIASSATPTYSIGSPSVGNIDENGPATSVSYTITTTNVANGTVLYPKYFVAGVSQGTLPSADLDGDAYVTINSNTGTITFYALADTTTEGSQTAYFELYTESGLTNKVATSQTVTINDTSLTPPTLSFVASATSTASTITIPATATTGDIAVLFDTSTTTTLTVPSGWSQNNSASTSGIRTTYSYRVLTSGQAGTSVTGMAGTTRKVMLVFRASSSYNQLSGYSNGSQPTTAAPSNQTLPLSSVSKPHLAFAVYAWTTTTPPRGWVQTGGSPTLVSSISTSGVSVNYQINNSGTSPNNATITMGDGGTNTLQTGYLTFT
jgi:hypothetical protein